MVRNDALGPVLALVVVTRARLEQNHWRRSFTEKSTVEGNGKKKRLQLSSFFLRKETLSDADVVLLLWYSSSGIRLPCARFAA